MRRNKKKNKLRHIRQTKNRTEIRRLKKEKKAKEKENRCQNVI